MARKGGKISGSCWKTTILEQNFLSNFLSSFFSLSNIDWNCVDLLGDPRALLSAPEKNEITKKNCEKKFTNPNCNVHKVSNLEFWWFQGYRIVCWFFTRNSLTNLFDAITVHSIVLKSSWKKVHENSPSNKFIKQVHEKSSSNRFMKKSSPKKSSIKVHQKTVRQKSWTKNSTVHQNT